MYLRLRLFNTLKNLKIRQIIFLIKYRLLNKTFIQLKKYFIVKKYYNTSLNTNIKIKVFDNEIIFNRDFSWSIKNQNKLFLYNLHYFNFLDKVNSKNIEQYKKIIYHWIDNNFIHLSVGLDPYPTSKRLINWINLISKFKLKDKKIINSIKMQSQFLKKNIEYHLDANHLISNLICIIYIINFDKSIFNLNERDYYYKVFYSELSKQILKDGGYFERSPSYHILILNDLLNLYYYLDNSKINIKIKNKLIKKIIVMNKWMISILHPDKNIPFFNDSNFSHNIDISNLLKRINAFLSNLNHPKYVEEKNKLIVLKDTGFYIYSNNIFKLISSISNIKPDFQPGHSHANSLAFELSFGKKRLFVNSGINTYENNTDRIYQRSTSAQNTIEINDKNSSDIWKSFRVGKRAKVFDLFEKYSNKSVIFGSSHNGYSSFFKKLIHKRTFKIYEDNFMIKDEIYGDFKKAIVRFFLHPDIKIQKNSFIIDNNIVYFKINNKFYIEESEWYPSFGKVKKNKNICIFLDSKKKSNIFELSF